MRGSTQRAGLLFDADTTAWGIAARTIRFFEFLLPGCILTVTAVIESELSVKGGAMAQTANDSWDLEADVIVVGSGAFSRNAPRLNSCSECATLVAAALVIHAQISNGRRAAQTELQRNSHHVNLWSNRRT